MALPEHPKRRSELIIRELGKGATRYWVVHDPKTDSFFRLEEPEYRIFMLMDGSLTLGNLVEVCRQRLGIEVSLPIIEDFVDQLQSLGFLEGEPGGTVKARPFQRETIFQKIFCIPVFAPNPERLLESLRPYVGWMFTPYFVIAAGVSILGGIWIAASNPLLWETSLAELFTLGNLVLLYLAFCITGFLHEMAHGMACTFFGGRVREMGFLLFYLTPAFYTDTSEAWLFPKRSHRIWVSASGVFFEMFMWSLAVMVWRITDPGTILHQFAFVTVISSGLDTIFNFNPLIRLDGYYILSDLLEIPNLRQRAFNYIGDRVFVLATGSPGHESIEDVAPREGRVFWIYGILALIYTATMLTIIFGFIGGFLLSEWGGIGLVLLLGLLFLCLYLPVRYIYNLIVRIGTELMRPEKRKRLAIILGIFLVVLLAMILIRWELVIKGPFEVKASQHVWVRATVPGQLKALYFTEGMHVNKGDKLALLDSTEYSLKLEESKAKLERAKAKLRLLKSGARREEIERAEARLKEAKAMLELMQKGFRPEEIQKAQARLNQARAHLELVMKGPRLEDIRRAEKRVAGLKIGWEYERRRYLRTKGLYEQGFATLDEYEKAKTRMEISYEELEQARSELRLLKAGARPEEIERAQAMVQEAELELRVLKAGSRPEEIEQARAKVKQVESELELLRAGSRIEEIQQAQANVRELEKAVQLYELYKERTVIRAPISGVIVTLHPEEKLGKMVSKGEDICEIADIRTLRVEIRVSEKDAADFREGSPVYLKFSSLPYDVFEGYGLALAPAILEGNPHNILIVTCKLDNPLFKLKPGMSGWARIYAGDRSLLQLMVRKLVRLIRVEFWWWFGS